MLFPTFEFALFFIGVFLVSWLIRKNRVAHRLFLIAASFFFYGYWNWRYAFLLFACCLGNYAFALLLEYTRARAAGYLDGSGNPIIRRSASEKSVFAFAMLYNLGILLFFKYYLFFTVNTNNLLITLGAHTQIPVLPIVLPVGISFFTFQGMSYTIDVYRKTYPPARSFLDVLLYISFFPQLVAGPIVRASDFLPQLTRPPSPRGIDTGKALVLILGGLVKKVFIAQYLAILLVDPVFANPLSFSWLESLMAVYGYAFQIFCDFSAYSDIAIGVAALLGYHFPPNFNKPYSALGIRDFWRRWHISLSAWLKDYLYISLGGNRRGRLRVYRNLLVTMVLGGMWHGAAWNFIFWGGLHGTGLVLERFVAERLRKRQTRRKEAGILEIVDSCGAGDAAAANTGRMKDHASVDGGPSIKGAAGRIMRVFLTFNFVCLGWIFFRSSSFGLAWDYLRSFANPLGSLALVRPFVVLLLAVGMGMHFIPHSWEAAVRKLFGRFHWSLQAGCLAALIFLLSATSPEGVAPFIYFQF